MKKLSNPFFLIQMLSGVYAGWLFKKINDTICEIVDDVQAVSDSFIVDRLFYEKSTVFDQGIDNEHMFIRIPVNFNGSRYNNYSGGSGEDFIDLLAILPRLGAPLSKYFESLDELKPHIPENSNHLIVFKAYKKSIRTMAEHFNLDLRSREGPNGIVIWVVDYNKNWFKQSDYSRDFRIIANGITQLCNFINMLGRNPCLLGFSFGVAMCLGTVEEMVRNGVKICYYKESEKDTTTMINHIYLLGGFKSLSTQISQLLGISKYFEAVRIPERYSFNNVERIGNIIAKQSEARGRIAIFHGTEDKLIPYQDSLEMANKYKIWYEMSKTYHCGIIEIDVAWKNLYERF